MSGAVEKALEFANVALLSGIAGSAIAPIIGEGEDASQWLALHGGKHLAEWAKIYQAHIHHENPGAATIAKALDESIRGKPSNVPRGAQIDDAYPKMGEEVVRMLNALNVPKLFEQVLVESSARDKVGIVGRLRKEMSKLAKAQPQNSYLYDYTLQQVAEQSLYISIGAEGQLHQELELLREEVRSLRARPTYTVVHSGGGTVVLDGVRVEGGNFIGRDGNTIGNLQLASKC
jgi:hypothetical protein